jgi:hypothetical protein
LIASATVPALAWLTFLGIGDQLAETMCATGASHRGTWFGTDVRTVIVILGILVLVLAAVCGVFALRQWSRLRGAEGTTARTRGFIALAAMLSAVLMTPIVIASMVFLVVEGPCAR